MKLMAVEHNRDRSPSAAFLRALVVDDYVLAAQGLAQLLEMLGHETRCTVRGREALRIAREFAPNLIMIDLHLGDINGFEVVNALRGDPRVGDSFIVAVSGWSRADYLARAKRSGFDHYVVKPIDLESLRHVIGAAELRAQIRQHGTTVPGEV